MKRFFSLLSLIFSLARAFASENSGESVVIVYNSSIPESKKVANHYAEKRNVPSAHILGLPLPISEIVTRQEYKELLQNPLLRFLEKGNLWVLDKHSKPVKDWTTSYPFPVLKSSIRYIVLCYGVPLKIAPDSKVYEPQFEKAIIPALRRNEAAVDSELALLPLLPLHPPVSGPFGNRAYGATNAASLDPVNGLLMVARLDGPSFEIANNLVDKALQAETNGLWGRAYFDLRGLTNSEYKLGDDWIRACALLAGRFGFETNIDDNPTTFPASFPLSHCALYAGWYDGNVSGPFTRPNVEFMPGAFAYHLHSFSAQSIRTTTEHWVGPLLDKGVTATMGCVEEPYLEGTPDIHAFFGRFLFLGFSFGEAAYASQKSVSWQTTVVGDPLYRPFQKHPEALHEELEARKSKLIEWSHLRVVNLNLAAGMQPPTMINYLIQIPETKSSAVLQEKLGDLYRKTGKLHEAVEPYETALKLEPSMQQRTRITLGLARLYGMFGKTQEAFDLFKEFLIKAPDYADQAAIYKQLIPLAEKLGKTADVEEFQRLAAKLHEA